MLTILAKSMMTATRQDCTPVHDLRKHRADGKRRWLRRRRCIDLNTL